MNPAYVLKDLTFSHGERRVLDLGEIEIPAGEIAAVVGPNGSGKTTLLHLLAFIERPQSGTISFFGEMARTENVLAFRRRVGLLLQEPYLFHMSVLANITWGLKLRGISERKSREMARQALESVDLVNFENRHARSLSGGESQRVALARALALDPEVLLLDEPENHLDKVSAERTEEIFLQMNRNEGKTVIVTTHNLLKGQSLAHRVFNLFRGKVVPAHPDNLFRGELTEDGAAFRTDSISVKLPIAESEGSYLTIDPTGIILSHHLPDPSMPNTFEGRVVAMSEENGRIRVEVEAGERLHLLMSNEAPNVQGTELGQRVWLVVKESAITVLA